MGVAAGKAHVFDDGFATLRSPSSVCAAEGAGDEIDLATELGVNAFSQFSHLLACAGRVEGRKAHAVLHDEAELENFFVDEGAAVPGELLKGGHIGYAHVGAGGGVGQAVGLDGSAFCCVG